MALILADRVQESTATSGTGTLTLGGASAQYQSFGAGIGNGNLCYYTILSGNGTDWENGLGLIGGGGTTLARTLIASSTGSLLNLTGTGTVFCCAPAAMLPPVMVHNTVAGIPPLSSFTQINISGNISAVENPGRAITIRANGNSFNNTTLCGIRAASPGATPYRVAMLVQGMGMNATFPAFQIGFSDGTKYQTVRLYVWPGTTGGSTENYSTNAVRSSTSGLNGTGVSTFTLPPTAIWFGLRNDGTTAYYEWSVDGAYWNAIHSFTISGSYLGNNLTNLFLGISPETTLTAANQLTISLRCWDTNGLNRVVG